MEDHELINDFLFHIENHYILNLMKKWFIEINDYYTGNPTDFIVFSL